MLKFGNKEFKNLQEQVLANANDILEIKQGLGTALPNPIIGPQGPQGIKGPQGPRGERGTEWTVGSELPASAEEGDIHLTFTGEVYQYENGWVLKTTIKGPQGPQGIKGPQGLQGETGPQGLQGPQGTAAPIYAVQGVLDGEEQLPDPETVPTNYAYIINDLIYGIVAGQWQSITSIGAYDRASEVSFNPTTDITSTNVQTAIEEVFDDSKSYIDGKALNLTREINELKDDKLDKNGYSALAHVGLADNIASPDGITDNAEFAFRASGGTASISDGFAEIKRLKGRTWIVNQLCINNASSQTINGITFTKNDDGSWTINGTATALTQFYFSQTYTPLVSGNKYILNVDNFNGSSTTYDIRIDGAKYNSQIFTCSTTVSEPMYMVIREGIAIDIIIKPRLTNLTKMFGAGNEPATVAQFNNLTRNIYLDAYNEGTFVNMNAEALESVGFNAFDGELELGNLTNIGGQNGTSTATVRSKNYIPVVGGETYTLTSAVSAFVGVFVYDKNQNCINMTGASNFDYYSLNNGSGEVVMPDNACYVRFFKSGTNTTEQICFHLTHSGYRNGQYEPYVKNTRTFYDVETYFPSGMRSAGTAYDEMTPKKAAINVGTVDLGTLNWYAGTNNRFVCYVSEISNFKTPNANNVKANMICAKYITYSTDDFSVNQQDNSISCPSGSRVSITIRDTSCPDVQSLLAKIKGVPLYYELAEPIIYDIETDEEWTYPVSDFGTEKAVDGAFLSADIFYMNNLRDKLRNLPDIPKCSETGTHVLKCINGTYTWVEE